MALALVASSELDLVDGDVAAVPPDMRRLRHGDRLHDDRVLLGVGLFISKQIFNQFQSISRCVPQSLSQL